MKKLSMLVLALFLLLAVGTQAYAEDISAGTDGTTVQRNNAPIGNNGDVGSRGGVGNRGTVGGQMDRTNTTNMNRNHMDNSRHGGGGVNTPGMRGTGGVGGFDNNMRAANTATDNNSWGWLGILGLLGLAGMFGRNRNPER